MGVGSAIAGGITGLAGASAAGKAAKAEARAQERQYQQVRSDLMPYQEAGRQALSLYQGMLTGQKDMSDVYMNQPGVQAALREGLKSVEGSAAARGGLFSGATLKALQQRGQDLASQQYQQYLDRMQGLAATGQSAAAGTAASGGAIAGAGQSRGTGIMGQYGAVGGGIGQIATGIGDWYQQKKQQS